MVRHPGGVKADHLRGPETKGSSVVVQGRSPFIGPLLESQLDEMERVLKVSREGFIFSYTPSGIFMSPLIFEASGLGYTLFTHAQFGQNFMRRAFDARRQYGKDGYEVTEFDNRSDQVSPDLHMACLRYQPRRKS